MRPVANRNLYVEACRSRHVSPFQTLDLTPGICSAILPKSSETPSRDLVCVTATRGQDGGSGGLASDWRACDGWLAWRSADD